MTVLEWNKVGQRLYESGVDKGVLFVEGASVGIPWNGLTGLSQRAIGADRQPKYIDGVKVSEETNLEEFQATLEAYTYPDEFAECDGSYTEAVTQVQFSQQPRKSFGLAYRTRIGNDLDGLDYGYQIHLIYGATATPTQRAFRTMSNTTDPTKLSWDLNTLPVAVPGYLPTSHLILDSTKLYVSVLSEIESIIFGTEVSDSRMPTPEEVIGIVGAYLPVVLIPNTALVPRINLFSNPRAKGDSGFASSAGQATITVPSVAPRYNLLTTAAINIGLSIGLTTGQTYRGLIRARANKNIVAIPRVKGTQVSSGDVVIETEWKWFDFTGVAGSGTTIQTGFVLPGNGGHQNGDWIEIDHVLIADGGDTGPWFWAGSSPGLRLPGIYMHEVLGVRDPRIPGDLVEIKPGIYKRSVFSSLIETAVDGLYKLEG